jgi:hypothetical protein
LKIGAAYSAEQNYNNGKGIPSGVVYDVDPEDGEIISGYYDSEKVDFGTPREHPLFKKGLEVIKNNGKDVSSILQKADQEVQNQEWIK